MKIKSFLCISLLLLLPVGATLGEPGPANKSDYTPTLGELVSFYDGQNGGEAATLRMISDGKEYWITKKSANGFCHPQAVSAQQIWRKDNTIIAREKFEHMLWQLNIMIACR